MSPPKVDGSPVRHGIPSSESANNAPTHVGPPPLPLGPAHFRGICVPQQQPEIFSYSVYDTNGRYNLVAASANSEQERLLAFAQDPIIFNGRDSLDHERTTRVRLGQPPFPLTQELILIQQQNALDDFSSRITNTTSSTQPRWQPTGAASHGRSRLRIPASSLEALVEVALERKPHLAPHGSKGKVWDEIAAALWDRKLFVGNSVATIKAKLQQLVKFHEDPNSPSCMEIRKEIEGTSTAIKLAALLDRLSESQKTAKKMSDEKKQKTQVKEEEDRVGGEAIRQASVHTLGLKRKSSSISGSERSGDTEPNSDSDENEDLSNPHRLKRHRPLTTSSSFRSAEGTANKESQEILELLKESDKREKEQGEQLLRAMAESTKVYKEASDKFLEAISSLRRD
ncbi:hypothetical protein K435DRAFT_794102 [Dendrothele bispora CBS 962.96]|uniref:Uncharacterized protein n=1 Tax=Dendrothele bispora (strain CBS 962.96) TaxID=1314807 RepID=A0A4S8MEH8_DENBC|nr:hypothetical protein K435DRAFT_794102 [Dendrothele bispora CBS 962.96]